MPVSHMPPKEASARVVDGVRIVDVRSPQEFAMGHPEGSLNIPIAFMSPMGMQPNGDFVAVMRKHFQPGDTIVFSCKSGGRSGMAADMMAAHGFTGELINVQGGYHGGTVPGWLAEGLPTSTETEGRSWDDLK